MSTPPPAQPAAPQPAQPAGPLTEAGDKQWASFAHFGGAIIILLTLLNFAGIPVGLQIFLALLAVVPSLVIYLVFGKRGPRTLVESKEALNFQITIIAATIIWIIISTAIFYAVASNLAFGFNIDAYYVLAFVLALPTFVLTVGNAVLSIIGGLKVQQGGSYRYPFALRLIK